MWWYWGIWFSNLQFQANGLVPAICQTWTAIKPNCYAVFVQCHRHHSIPQCSLGTGNAPDQWLSDSFHISLCKRVIWYVCLSDRHQLQCPGQYSPLEAFYEDKRAVLPPAGNGPACPTWSVTNINRCMHAEMKVCNLAGCILSPDKGMCAHAEGFLFFLLLPVDNPPRWLHVPVHSVFWGADYGPLEVCVAQETSAYFLPSTCRCGLLQGWEAHKHTHIERTVLLLLLFLLTPVCFSSQCIAVAAWPTSRCQE